MKSFGLAALFNANLASRGALFGAFGVPVFEYPWKKRKPCFLLTVHHFLRFFELPGGKKTSKKPFRLVNYEVLVGENVKSFGLAAFLDDNPRPNQDFWRSQSAFPRFLRVEMGPKSKGTLQEGEPGGGDLGEFTCGKRWGFRRVFALATTVELQVASLTAPS